MPAACRQLRRQGHAVRAVSIARPGVRVCGGWAVGGTTYCAVLTPAPPAALGHENAVLVREVAEPTAVSVARAVLARFAEREGAPETVRSALALAVTEACKNVVTHAYADATLPESLRCAPALPSASSWWRSRTTARAWFPTSTARARDLACR